MLPEVINHQRHMYVVKSNKMVRDFKFELSAREWKMMNFFISEIKPGDDGKAEYTYSIRKFCAVCGIRYRENFSSVKETVKALRDKSLWIQAPDGRETLVSWIEKVSIFPNTDKITVRFDQDVTPYLVNLREQGNFTQYELFAVLGFKCKFSFRFYELFKSWESYGYWLVEIQQLKNILLIKKNYPKFSDFRRYVLDLAIDEINTHTELNVDYSTVLSGRKIDSLAFTIKRKEHFDGQYLNVLKALGECEDSSTEDEDA